MANLARNKAASSIGFGDFYEMQLYIQDQSPEEIDLIFNETEELTSLQYKRIKKEIDVFLSQRINIPEEELRPWHYQNQFFQEAPNIYKLNLDSCYKGKNLVSVANKYYQSIGLQVNGILSNSDLFEKTGKIQHTYSVDIDKSGDVRVVCNVQDNYYWMNSLLYEFGFAIYMRNIDDSLSYTLREPTSFFINDAVAIMFSQLAANPDWMVENVNLPQNEANELREKFIKNERLLQFVFLRWSQVMYRFERSMYKNPNQDLNILWKMLVRKYQLLNYPEDRNEPDWASKIHIVTAPCNYHNYTLGTLAAAQIKVALKEYLSENYQNSLSNNKKIGQFFKERIFKYGKNVDKKQLMIKATGNELSPKFFVREYIEN